MIDDPPFAGADHVRLTVWLKVSPDKLEGVLGTVVIVMLLDATLDADIP